MLWMPTLSLGHGGRHIFDQKKARVQKLGGLRRLTVVTLSVGWDVRHTRRHMFAF